jgi:hypothetical protein
MGVLINSLQVWASLYRSMETIKNNEFEIIQGAATENLLAGAHKFPQSAALYLGSRMDVIYEDKKFNCRWFQMLAWL